MQPKHRDDGVSSVVGTILMVAITVTIFGGLSIMVMSQFSDDERPAQADLVAQHTNGTWILDHQGGDAILSADSILHVNVNGVDVEYPLSSIASLGGDGFGIGDRICIQGTQPSCLYDQSANILGFYLVSANTLLSSEGEVAGGIPITSSSSTSSTTSSSTTSSGPPANLTAAISGQPGTVVAGTTVSLVLTTENVGGSTATSIQNEFVLDGAVVSSYTIPSLAAGSSHLAYYNFTAVAGAHTSTFSVDHPDAITAAASWKEAEWNFNALTQPQLTATITGKPASVAIGSNVQIGLRVTNTGGLDAGAFQDQFIFNGVVVGTYNVPSLAAGESATVNYTFTATAGSHTSRFNVDIANVITPASGIKSAYWNYTSVASPLATNAFKDANGNGIYDAGDTLIPIGNMINQDYNAGWVNVVIPAELGTISGNWMNIENTAKLTIKAGLNLNDDFETNAQNIEFIGSTVHAEDMKFNNPITVKFDGASMELDDLDMGTPNSLTVQNSVITGHPGNGQNKLEFKATASTRIDIISSTLSPKKDIDLTAPIINIQSSQFNSEDHVKLQASNTLTIASTNIVLPGGNYESTSSGATTITGGKIEVNGKIEAFSSSTMTITTPNFIAKTGITLGSSGGFSLNGGSLSSTNGNSDIKVTAGGAMTFTNTIAKAGQSLELTAGSTLNVSGSSLWGDNNQIKLTAGISVNVGGSKFYRNPNGIANTAKVYPGSTSIIGTPTFGSAVHG